MKRSADLHLHCASGSVLLGQVCLDRGDALRRVCLQLGHGRSKRLGAGFLCGAGLDQLCPRIDLLRQLVGNGGIREGDPQGVPGVRPCLRQWANRWRKHGQ